MDHEKYHLLNNHFKPDHKYQFPLIQYGKQKRSFQHNWLTRFNGLVYSELDQGGYCKYCVLFGQAAFSVSTFDGILIDRPLTNLQKASEKLREHFEGIGSGSARKYHLLALEKAELFISVMENKCLPVDQQISKARALTIAKNKRKLKSIVETIIFCGRQGIALCGHRDDYKLIKEVPHANPGNFIALLHFRAASGDQVLTDHLASAGANALYTSKTIQNQIIKICGTIIRSTILNHVRTAELYSLLADEATDASNKEQLAVCVRFVDQCTLKIEERFMAFSECDTGVTGKAIAECLLSNLDEWQLPASHMIGQTYDGAGAMAGRKKGAAARIAEFHPKAIYTHCAAHALNLCVVKCCSIPEIRNAMDIADSICRFFCNSPKRQLALEKWVSQMLEGEQRRKIKSVCKTRWVERHEAFEVFLDLFQPLVCCFEELKDSTESNHETRNLAQSFFLSLSRFPFIFSLVVTKEILGYTKALSIKLQGRYVDVVRAFKDVNFVLEVLRGARQDIDSFHNRIYAAALTIATKLNVDESRPRTTGRQQHRGNAPSSSTSEYFQRQLTIPALDYLISEVSDLFSSRLTATLAQIMILLPSFVAKSTHPLTSADISDLLSIYKDDLPTPSSLETELHCWSVKWKGKTQEASSLDNPLHTLSTIDDVFFPNIKKLFKIACTLPVTSTECERSVSRLRYLKTYLRSTMVEERLNGLAMLYVHRDIPCSPDAVVSEFARLQPRRLELVNPFIDDSQSYQ